LDHHYKRDGLLSNGNTPDVAIKVGQTPSSCRILILNIAQGIVKTVGDTTERELLGLGSDGVENILPMSM